MKHNGYEEIQNSVERTVQFGPRCELSVNGPRCASKLAPDVAKTQMALDVKQNWPPIWEKIISPRWVTKMALDVEEILLVPHVRLNRPPMWKSALD